MESPDPVAAPTGTVSPEWVVRALPDGLWMFDTDGATTYSNAALLAMLGRDAPGADAFTVFDVLDEQGQADFARHLATRDREAAAGHDLECCLHRLDGSEFWALVSHVPLLDDQGERRGWLYRVRDHSEQRALLDELVRREQQAAEAQIIAGVGSWERDVVTGVVDWSEQAYRLCRVDPTTFVPKDRSLSPMEIRLMCRQMESVASGDAQAHALPRHHLSRAGPRGQRLDLALG